MFWKNTQFKQRYYNFIFNLFGYKKVIKTLPVDFNKPWWDIIWKQRNLFSIIFLTEIVQGGFVAYLSIFLGKALATGDIWYLVYIFLGWTGVVLFENIANYLNPIFQIQTMNSVMYEAHKYFITTDPIFHSTKSSGQILAKVNRGSGAYENYLDIITFDLLPVVGGFIAIISSFLQFSINLAITGIVFYFLTTVISISANIFNSQVQEPFIIEKNDKLSGINVENLQQQQFIRSVFGAPEMVKKLKRINLDYMSTEATQWRSSNTLGSLFKMFFMLGTAAVTFQVFWMIKAGSMPLSVGISLVVAYYTTSSTVLRVGRRVNSLIKSQSQIEDLFTFIRSFGKQTYPVLEGEVPPNLKVRP